MKLTKLFTDERAISPVVGVALLIAIAVILATAIGAVVLDLSPGGANAPQADLAGNYDTTNDELTVKHNGGDALEGANVKFVSENSSEVTLSSKISDEELSAGESITLTNSDFGASGDTPFTYEDTITTVWEAPNSDKSNVLGEFEP